MTEEVLLSVPAAAPAAAESEPATRPAPWRGRRTVADARTKVVHIRCSPAEHRRLDEQAAKSGLQLGPYLRAAALGSAGLRARRRPPLEREAIAQLLGQVGRVGGNVNQLARAMNETGNFPARAELARAADELAAIRAALMRALGREP